MKNKPWYPIAYMFAVTLFFSSIIIGLSALTRDRVEANQKLAFEKAVLDVLPIEVPAQASNLELHDLYVKLIQDPTPSSGSAYIYKIGNEIKGYALPISGKGFWDEISGVVGIAPDKKTITGISFYKQNETPGLGAEIAQLPFREQFVGKTIAKTGAPFNIKPVSEQTDDNSVHAVTGATQTSIRLEKFLLEQLEIWRKAMM
ncbi:MAG: FMN-binding protein [Candidatus Auribacter fodinae]|jgi:Na+-transporting NADH:ubiquinone oxidoreductase subunit C|uniref:FMN-binding protein n=1 Tax=Candidatus Auribacter fodinae TaxID=2093366 RepID=A0A3A4R8H1_9BACT|nr:MAG: FMN-binding protein [Candidatus Auribacter fodinae]